MKTSSDVETSEEVLDATRASAALTQDRVSTS